MLPRQTHVFSEIFIHLTWHCKRDYRGLQGRLRDRVYRYIEERCAKTRGVLFIGLGGTADHIHLLIQMTPDVCLADFVGDVKGGSSYDINKEFRRKALYWQRGYGAVSFAKRNTKALIRYVESQEEHHRRGTVNATLENHGMYEENLPGEQRDESPGDREGR